MAERAQVVRRMLGILGFFSALWVWWATLGRVGTWGPVPPAVAPSAILVASLLPLAAVIAGRLVLDRHPTTGQAEWVTIFVHYGVAIPLGAAIIAAVLAAAEWPCTFTAWVAVSSSRLHLPCPTWPPIVGNALIAVSGGALALTVVNLARRGCGAPFAIALTSRLATDRLYAWSRNPMVLAGLATLVSIGIRLGSWWFIAWTLLVLTPLMLMFLKIYEERELEIRFGGPYVEYRRKTPMLIPRRPRA